MTIIPDKSPVARRQDGASAAMRGVGLRLTGPRRLVLEVVRGSDAHRTAEAVRQMVRCRLSRVSLGTVYRAVQRHRALAYVSSTEPLDGRTPAARHRLPKATAMYWRPWSACWMM